MSRSKRKKLTWYALHISIRGDDFWEPSGACYGCLCCFLQSPMLSSLLIIFVLQYSDESPFVPVTPTAPSLSDFYITSLLTQTLIFSFNNFITKNEHCLNKIYLFWFKYYRTYSSVRNIIHTLFLSIWNELKCCYWFLIGLYFKSVLELLLYFEWGCKCSLSNFFFYFDNYKGRKN